MLINKTSLAFVIMLLISQVLMSVTCTKGPNVSTDNSIIGVSGSWDYTNLYHFVYDSSTSASHSESIFDTGFAYHSQNSYQFNSNGNVIYTDYTVIPNSIKNGVYYTTNVVHGPYYFMDTSNDYFIGTTGNVILKFPSSTPDTLNFRNYSGSTQLEFIQEKHDPNILTRIIQYYTAY